MGDGAHNVKAIVEALLFAGSEPVRPSEIREILAASLPPGDGTIRALIEELRDDYRKGGRSFTIAEIAGGYRLQTLPEYGDWISRLRAAPSRRKLSAPALETLAIVAYRQPITKAEIEAIRGVNIDGVLENLMDRELVETKGRKQAIGKPHLFGTTKRFLEHFGLRTIKDLPEIEELKRAVAAGAPAGAAPPAERQGPG
jgi:segregation and condensation protein B